MRLLDLDTDSGIQPQAAVLGKKHPRKPVRKPPRQQARPTTLPPQQHNTVYPLHGNAAVQQPVRRKPIDLEQLQQRIEVLEKRMRQRERNNSSGISAKDIKQLRQRMQLLERSMHNELWSARQREHALLEMLARPPLTTSLRLKGRKLLQQDLPATGRKLHSAGSAWWQDHQPEWWPQFMAAWQESLDRARGIEHR